VKRWRFKVVYLVLLPAIVIAACVLGYYTYQTAVQLSLLGEKSISHSILLLVKDRVDSIERQIIAADEAVFGLIDLAHPDQTDQTWAPQAPEISPSVRAVIILDADKRVLGYAARASKKDKYRFLKIFQSQIAPDLELERQPEYVLKHFHHTYDGQYYLISYKTVIFEGQRFYLIAHHDTGYIVRNTFPDLFSGELAGQLYNVVNERNQRVFGPSLDHAGDYVVARRFPTTLYNWRLQIAPREAPLLASQKQTTRFNQAALIGLSLAVILLGTLFVLYAADKERRLNELKSEFIANVSHELKTPLSVIRMFGEMLLTGRVRDRQKAQQYIETICS
jgi:two-component system phosphate regulon sensor histidine kinase PhoR